LEIRPSNARHAPNYRSISIVCRHQPFLLFFFCKFWLATRRFVAGICGCDDQPALRRFTRYNYAMMDSPVVSAAPPPSTAFSKRVSPSFSSKKPSFFSGNWTFRDRKQSRPNVVPEGMRRYVPVGHSLTLAGLVHSRRLSDYNPLRKSCPDLEAATVTPLPSSDDRGARRRNRRAKEKIREACWRRKPVENWALDDVLLWLQACSLDDVASLLIGYDLRGTDLLSWDHNCLSQLGVTNASIREKILKELAAIRQRGPEIAKENEKKNVHRALFDIVKQSAYDQVLAVETPLTTRDIIVTHGRLGCLQITKVNGVNLPLRENDCLLEINDCAGEQFKSALMLTKLINDSNGSPIRFVVLRMKTSDRDDDSFVSAPASRISIGFGTGR
ncbi:unnamed protein product, partial [Heligmosomoides polygyrus]|uniref:SAM domain-containing protein n=1 Tax=Heligmosomoides polygyrus TaxID=6339 RepID=A0A183FJ97_HELPZ